MLNPRINNTALITNHDWLMDARTVMRAQPDIVNMKLLSSSRPQLSGAVHCRPSASLQITTMGNRTTV